MNEMIDISKLKTYSNPHKVYIPSKYGSFVKRADIEQLLETAHNSDYAVPPSASPKSCANCFWKDKPPISACNGCYDESNWEERT